MARELQEAVQQACHQVASNFLHLLPMELQVAALQVYHPGAWSFLPMEWQVADLRVCHRGAVNFLARAC